MILSLMVSQSIVSNRSSFFVEYADEYNSGDPELNRLGAKKPRPRKQMESAETDFEQIANISYEQGSTGDGQDASRHLPVHSVQLSAESSIKSQNGKRLVTAEEFDKNADA